MGLGLFRSADNQKFRSSDCSACTMSS